MPDSPPPPPPLTRIFTKNSFGASVTGKFDEQRKSEETLVSTICDRLVQATGDEDARDTLAREILSLKEEVASFDTVRESYVAARGLTKLLNDAMELIVNGSTASDIETEWLQQEVHHVFDQKKGML